MAHNNLPQILSPQSAQVAAGLDVQQIDPRTLLITTLLFVTIVASYPRHQLSALLPFFSYPLYLLHHSGKPAQWLIRRLLAVSPFVLAIALVNPLLETETIMIAGNTWHIGWISLLSILLRFILTASAALLLLATTNIAQLSNALARLGVPHIFCRQLLFLHRYIDVLSHEATTIYRAAKLRSFSRKRLSWRSSITLLGQLLLRAIGRATRVHQAILSRGFHGHITTTDQHSGWRDIAFLLFWSGLFILLRQINLPQQLGQWLMEISL